MRFALLVASIVFSQGVFAADADPNDSMLADQAYAQHKADRAAFDKALDLIVSKGDDHREDKDGLSLEEQYAIDQDRNVFPPPTNRRRMGSTTPMAEPESHSMPESTVGRPSTYNHSPAAITATESSESEAPPLANRRHTGPTSSMVEPESLPRGELGPRYSHLTALQATPVNADVAMDMMDDCQDLIKQYKTTNVACYEDNRHFHRIVDRLAKICDKNRIDAVYSNFEDSNKLKNELADLLEGGAFTEAVFRTDSMYPAAAKACEKNIAQAKSTATRLEFLADTLLGKNLTPSSQLKDGPQESDVGTHTSDGGRVSFTQR